MQNNAAAIEVLLANGADVDARDRHLMTPLHWAVRGHYPQRTEALAVLIAAGADVGATDINGMTPLHHASQRARSEMARTLLEAGAPMGPDKRGRTPLILACGRRRHRADTVNTLIEFGADIKARDKKGYTPVLLTARHGHYGALDALIRAGAEAKDSSPAWFLSEPALHMACCHNHPVCAELLIRAGGSADSHWRGDFPLDLACRHADCEKLLGVLISAGADVNRRDTMDTTPLIRTVIGIPLPLRPWDYTGETAISCLLKAGADANAADGGGRTALHYACSISRPAIVAILLAAGADTRALNVDGQTPAGLTRDPEIRAMFEPRVKNAAA